MILFGSLTSFLWTTFIPKSKILLNNNDDTNTTTTNIDDSTTTEDEETAGNDSQKSERGIKIHKSNKISMKANDNITWWRHYNSK